MWVEMEMEMEKSCSSPSRPPDNHGRTLITPNSSLSIPLNLSRPTFYTNSMIVIYKLTSQSFFFDNRSTMLEYCSMKIVEVYCIREES